MRALLGILLVMAATYDPAADDFSPDDLGPRRTSILAIISLILSLICIIPGAGLLGAIFGLAGIIGISQSRGRVGGMGLAIAGLALGLLFTAVWVGFGVGASKFFGMFRQAALAPITATMTAIEAGDRAGSRAALAPEIVSAVTDERLDAFRDAYRAELGSFIMMPQNVMEIWLGYRSAAPVLKGAGNFQNMIPFPAQFDKGWTIVAVEIRPDRGPAPSGQQDRLNILNIYVLTLDGRTRIALLEGGTPPPPPVPEPPEPAAADPGTTTEPGPARDPAAPGGDKGPS